MNQCFGWVGSWGSTLLLLGVLFGSAHASAESKVLRVLTYNVHGLPLPWFDATRYTDIGRELARAREAGTAPEVVFLQETFDPRTREIAKLAGYPFQADGPRGWFLKLSSGIRILSEYPILSVKRGIYKDCLSWDCAARKGFVRVQIQVPGSPEPLTIYNTHLQSDPDGDASVSIEQTRQIRELQTRRVAEAAGTEAGPVLFSGDFNFTPAEPSYGIFTRLSRMTDAAETCAMPSACTGDGSASEHLSHSVDRHFYSRNPEQKLQILPTHFQLTFTEPVRGRMLSDHVGVETHYLLWW